MRKFAIVPMKIVLVMLSYIWFGRWAIPFSKTKAKEGKIFMINQRYMQIKEFGSL